MFTTHKKGNYRDPENFPIQVFNQNTCFKVSPYNEVSQPDVCLCVCEHHSSKTSTLELPLKSRFAPLFLFFIKWPKSVTLYSLNTFF